jgi:hypothetical protein
VKVIAGEGQGVKQILTTEGRIKIIYVRDKGNFSIPFSFT